VYFASMGSVIPMPSQTQLVLVHTTPALSHTALDCGILVPYYGLYGEYLDGLPPMPSHTQPVLANTTRGLSHTVLDCRILMPYYGLYREYLDGLPPIPSHTQPVLQGFLILSLIVGY